MQLKYSEGDLLIQRETIDKEAEYILDRLKQVKTTDRTTIKKKIAMVLELNKKDLFDIPYIAYYKRIVFETELNQADIWKIFELDKEWIKFNENKKKIEKAFEVVKHYIDEPKYFPIEKRFIEGTYSNTELKDVEGFIEFIKEIFFEEVNTQKSLRENNITLRPLINSFAKNLKQYHPQIIKFAESFTISSYELATNLELIYSENKLTNIIVSENPSAKPSIKAFDFINNTYVQEIDVLKITCKFAALELSKHPYIRSFVRKLFFKNAKVFTEPTEKGKVELDIFHIFFKTKRIVGKPIDDFKNDLFLYMQEAENSDLIKILIDIDAGETQNIIEKIKRAYINCNASHDDQIVREWNLVREEVIKILIANYLLPDFINDARNELIVKAENYIAQECAKKFYSHIIMGPYKKIKEINEDEVNFLKRDENYVKVASVVLDNETKKVSPQ